MPTRTKVRFRAGVGAVIANDRGEVLALERDDIAGAWQFPQGGLKNGEEPLAAVLREISEETGISNNDLRLVDECPELLAYQLPPDKRSPKTGRGQVQRWFLFRFVGQEQTIRLPVGGEFRAWVWRSFEAVASDVVDFKKPVYSRLVERFGRFLDAGQQ